ncbi:Alcohol dehydrogenase GroES-like domain-containing protein [Streptomyces sp. 3213]|uniref:zinc-binding dehydrogenase n=1 Tax=Streptomyces sp. 3213.3 TaxID=1855348 RepID=UPI000898CFF7|nr:zinc-binding dehydrogenase [Streptomyces sp. 3213.3]SED77602.1 Alcohol dehydrogenase GroES-like domain-containing protein [Streptomyces sp. 3213] [Streptomyces sp. 3213.3]
MRASAFKVTGGPEVLRLVDLPDPEPGPGEILIRVAYAGVNYGEIQHRLGDFGEPDGETVTGLEASGRVAALGEDVTGVSVGDPVTAYLPDGGGYAEYAVAPATFTFPLAGASAFASAGGFEGRAGDSGRREGGFVPGASAVPLPDGPVVPLAGGVEGRAGDSGRREGGFVLGDSAFPLAGGVGGRAGDSGGRQGGLVPGASAVPLPDGPAVPLAGGFEGRAGDSGRPQGGFAPGDSVVPLAGGVEGRAGDPDRPQGGFAPAASAFPLAGGEDGRAGDSDRRQGGFALSPGGPGVAPGGIGRLPDGIDRRSAGFASSSGGPGPVPEGIDGLSDGRDRRPAGLDLRSAGGAALVLTTAYGVLVGAARIAPGDTVLVHAAAGGVGGVAAQLARALGASEVYGTVSTPEKAEYARRSFGYDEVFVREGFPEAVLAATSGRGVDIVLDPVGGPTRLASFEALAPFGRVAVYGEAARHPDLQLRVLPIWKNNRTLTGYNIGDLARRAPATVRAHALAALALAASGAVRIDVTEEYALADAAEAHRLLGEGRNRGKVVLAVGDPA